jgi:hypothetical protein
MQTCGDRVLKYSSSGGGTFFRRMGGFKQSVNSVTSLRCSKEDIVELEHLVKPAKAGRLDF